ncbi:hypothetical protein ERJ75_000193000 [Trypanosoma vivax]|uniref:Uncharacterized protein n=1 Tax=Trypanosoma vivax (strain Y486) TaxID=1055687 RepID=G0UA46_TRYVY|nr:hypothetical protein TRVL_03580 [Trypanosoma vivax]KAH8619100.1 hypothetical protein ERJ75_000193000 [Trypanosoma vivax]CCC52678.1 conserved hypothetical protein [Trypanosoma vivax Y486]
MWRRQSALIASLPLAGLLSGRCVFVRDLRTPVQIEKGPITYPAVLLWSWRSNRQRHLVLSICSPDSCSGSPSATKSTLDAVGKPKGEGTPGAPNALKPEDYFFGRMFLRPYDVASLLTVLEGKVKQAQMQKQHSSLRLRPVKAKSDAFNDSAKERSGKKKKSKSKNAPAFTFLLAGKFTTKSPMVKSGNAEGETLWLDDDDEGDAVETKLANGTYNLNDQRNFRATLKGAELIFVMRHLEAVLSDMFGIQHQHNMRVVNELLKGAQPRVRTDVESNLPSAPERRYRSMGARDPPRLDRGSRRESQAVTTSLPPKDAGNNNKSTLPCSTATNNIDKEAVGTAAAAVAAALPLNAVPDASNSVNERADAACTPRVEETTVERRLAEPQQTVRDHPRAPVVQPRTLDGAGEKHTVKPSECNEENNSHDSEDDSKDDSEDSCESEDDEGVLEQPVRAKSVSGPSDDGSCSVGADSGDNSSESDDDGSDSSKSSSGGSDDEFLDISDDDDDMSDDPKDDESSSDETDNDRKVSGNLDEEDDCDKQLGTDDSDSSLEDSSQSESSSDTDDVTDDEQLFLGTDDSSK